MDGHDLTFAKTSEDVMARLSREKYGMVILSVHFDESQMFALLGDIRGHGVTARFRSSASSEIAAGSRRLQSKVSTTQ